MELTWGEAVKTIIFVGIDCFIFALEFHLVFRLWLWIIFLVTTFLWTILSSPVPSTPTRHSSINLIGNFQFWFIWKGENKIMKTFLSSIPIRFPSFYLDNNEIWIRNWKMDLICIVFFLQDFLVFDCWGNVSRDFM